MSLLPKLPCRRLYIDSRFAEGTATDFVVNIPEAGLDLPDNCVAYVDSISVPSIQNVPYTRNRLYYKERNAAGLERVLVIDLFPWNYSADSWASNVQTKLNNKTSKLITATYDVSYTTSGNFIQFKLTGGAAGESSRILTDHELSEMAYHPPYWGLNGTTWQAPHYNMTGIWYSGDQNFGSSRDMLYESFRRKPG